MNAQVMQARSTSDSANRPAFGTVLASTMALATWRDGKWSPQELRKYGPIELSPAIHGLHYGSTCFEGFKAYRWADGSINIFRMDRHVARLCQSARGLVLPVPDAGAGRGHGDRRSSTASATKFPSRRARCTCARCCSARARASAARPRLRPRRC